MPTPGDGQQCAIIYETGAAAGRTVVALAGIFPFTHLFLAALQIGAQRFCLAGAAYFLATGAGLPPFPCDCYIPNPVHMQLPFRPPMAWCHALWMPP